MIEWCIGGQRECGRASGWRRKDTLDEHGRERMCSSNVLGRRA